MQPDARTSLEIAGRMLAEDQATPLEDLSTVLAPRTLDEAAVDPGGDGDGEASDGLSEIYLDPFDLLETPSTPDADGELSGPAADAASDRPEVEAPHDVGETRWPSSETSPPRDGARSRGAQARSWVDEDDERDDVAVAPRRPPPARAARGAAAPPVAATPAARAAGAARRSATAAAVAVIALAGLLAIVLGSSNEGPAAPVTEPSQLPKTLSPLSARPRVTRRRSAGAERRGETVRPSRSLRREAPRRLRRDARRPRPARPARAVSVIARPATGPRVVKGTGSASVGAVEFSREFTP